jgi:hypothetical protein
MDSDLPERADNQEVVETDTIEEDLSLLSISKDPHFRARSTSGLSTPLLIGGPRAPITDKNGLGWPGRSVIPESRHF